MPLKSRLTSPTSLLGGAALVLLVLSGCRIIQIVPEGGMIVSRTGDHDCVSGETCTIDVENGSEFSDTFSAEPDPAYRFVGWKQADRFLCGGGEGDCALEGVPGSFTDQDLDLFLEPVFELDPDNPLIDTDMALAQAYSHINRVRVAAGMPEFGHNDELSVAAAGHANFLELNNITGHFQQDGLPGFTGVQVSDRVVAAGHNTRAVGEGIAYVQQKPGSVESIEALMTAIYHRFSILDLSKDLIGMGYAVDEIDSETWVYNYGNTALNDACGGESFDGFGTFVFGICADEDFRIEQSQYLELAQGPSADSPAIVVWPPADGRQVRTVFYGENPDPLPNIDVSANPVSVEFNPLFFPEAPTLTRLDLYADGETDAVEVLTLMNAANDPNSNFTEYQHALFPAERLDRDRVYRAELEYIDSDGMSHSHSWSFTTERLQYEVFTVESDQTLEISVGDTFVVYMPPRDVNDVQPQCLLSSTLDLAFIDHHTFLVTQNETGFSSSSLSCYDKTVTFSFD